MWTYVRLRWLGAALRLAVRIASCYQTLPLAALVIISPSAPFVQRFLRFCLLVFESCKQHRPSLRETGRVTQWIADAPRPDNNDSCSSIILFVSSLLLLCPYLAFCISNSFVNAKSDLWISALCFRFDSGYFFVRLKMKIGDSSCLIHFEENPINRNLYSDLKADCLSGWK